MSLVDAQGVDPECAWTIDIAQALESMKKILCDIEGGVSFVKDPPR